MSRKVGIVAGGGDCAGLNAVTEAVVKSGLKDGYEFLGIKGSFEGLLEDPQVIPLDYNTVDNISHLGGTILHTTNKGKFSAKVGNGEGKDIPMELLNEAKANADNLGIEALVVIGGDGTLSGAAQLSMKTGMNIVGVPKTIDNDLCFTEMTFGFHSAVEFVADALDRVHTTADSHNRLIIVETMGRNSGWISLYGGIAGYADVILIPEIPFDYHKILNHVRGQRAFGQNYHIMVVAEGAKAVDENQVTQAEGENKENQLGGISYQIMAKLSEIASGEFEVRNVILGHLQRGGSPIAFDRILAQRYGAAAMQAVKRGDFGKMVRMENNQISTIEIEKVLNCIKNVQSDSQVLQTAKDLGIYLGNDF